MVPGSKAEGNEEAHPAVEDTFGMQVKIAELGASDGERESKVWFQGGPGDPSPIVPVGALQSDLGDGVGRAPANLRIISAMLLTPFSVFLGYLFHLQCQMRVRLLAFFLPERFDERALDTRECMEPPHPYSYFLDCNHNFPYLPCNVKRERGLHMGRVSPDAALWFEEI